MRVFFYNLIGPSRQIKTSRVIRVFLSKRRGHSRCEDHERPKLTALTNQNEIIAALKVDGTGRIYKISPKGFLLKRTVEKMYFFCCGD